MTSAPLLHISNLVKTFPEIRAVDGVSFSIDQGQCFGLLGPNGAGKTTTIEVIEGISPETSGTILYKGNPRAMNFREEIGIQLQNTELPQFLTVKETLETFRDLYDNRADLDSLIESCRLEDILHRDNRKISGGQKQRVLLAIALANDPELVFLDEPTTGLDPQARRYLWDIVRKIKAQNKTVILTTHYMEEAQILCDTVAIMDQGRIIAMGSPEQLVREHLGSASIILKGDISDELLHDLECRWFRLEDRIEIQTDSVNSCISYLMARNIDLASMSVRAQNLEDLFLKLTGKKLRS